MKIAVFVCDCGTNIASVVDVPDVVAFASTLPDVALAEEGKWICAVDYLDKLKKLVNEHGIERVVVACCTPRTHEVIFKSALKEAGLNPNLLEFCGIREYCSWVHKSDPAAATAKAKDLLAMAVAKARLLLPAEPLRIPIGRTALVIGGGIAGMTAAAALADQSFNVILIERSDRLGGLVNELAGVGFDSRAPSELLNPMLERVHDNELIDVRLGTELDAVEGYIGNFKVKLRTGAASETVAASTIIVATGMSEQLPHGLCGYGTSSSVVTALEFERMRSGGSGFGSIKLRSLRAVAVIGCVGSRNEHRGCCNIGCANAVKWLNDIKTTMPSTELYLFYRDIIVPGLDSDHAESALRKADALVRYRGGELPDVAITAGGRLRVSARDMLLEDDVAVEADLVVLLNAYGGDRSANAIKQLLRVPLGTDNFFQEAHIKLRPLDFATDGIYVAGCARSVKSATETIEEALGAAIRAAIPMKRGHIESTGLVAVLDPEKCITCEICVRSCGYGAVEQLAGGGSVEGSKCPGVEGRGSKGLGVEGSGAVGQRLRIIDALCKGCGTCAAGCPEHAIAMTNFTDSQLDSQVAAALSEHPEQKLIAFCCHWCALGAADLSGVSRYQYPPDLRLIRVMCSGRIDPELVMRAFERGAPGVMVAGCEIPTCHYISGNIYASYRMELLRRLLELAGIEPERLRVEWLSAAQGDKFAKTMTAFSNDIRRLPAIPDRVRSTLAFSAALYCAGSERLRLLVGNLPELEREGNAYGERMSRHELFRILDHAVEDEFATQKISRLLRGKAMSVKELARESALAPPKALRIVLGLVRSGKVRRERIDGFTPIYALIPEPAESSIPTCIGVAEGGADPEA